MAFAATTMPAPFGVTPTGFSRPSVQELLALIEADQRAEISTTLDLSSDQPWGQNNAIFARQLGVAWEALEAIHDGNDPDRAEDDAATSIAKITGTEREGASRSRVTLSVTLAIGTTLTAATHFAQVAGKPDVRFTPVDDFTASGPSDPQVYAVDFEAENTGPIQAAAGTITVIATPVVGWSAVTNVGDAVPGRNVDTDADLRVRREQGLQRAGGSTTDGIRADVLAVPSVTSCQVFENWTDATDANGLPPKSFEVVLWDDSGADDDAVAQAIWNSKPGGIRPIGSESGTATDANSDPHTMYFSRATAIDVYVTFRRTARDGYVGDDALKLAMVTELNSVMGTGADVAEWDIADSAHGLGAKLADIKFGTSPSPTGSSDLVIGNTEIARFDTSRVTITT